MSEQEQPEVLSQIFIQIDHESASMRHIVRIKVNGVCLHESRKYGGWDVRKQMLQKARRWLNVRRFPVPDHYYAQRFEGNRETWEKVPLSSDPKK